jgi:hypothetical protein
MGVRTAISIQIKSIRRENNFAYAACYVCLLGSISSTFYVRIFCTKVHSKPNSKQEKGAQKTFVQKMRA